MQKFFLLDYSQDGFERFATIEDLNKNINDKTCAIMIETVQGEGGVCALDPEFIKYVDKAEYALQRQMLKIKIF